MLIDHITSMGYTLENASDTSSIETLLSVCNLEAYKNSDSNTYRIVKTGAGGVAACVGWTIVENIAILHSLAVAPASRGRGLGVGLLATVMAELKDLEDVSAFYVVANGHSIVSLFSNLGFFPVYNADVPEHMTKILQPREEDQVLVRSYDGIKRGLDRCAFQLIENSSEDASTPLGSVFMFKQYGAVIESEFRGGEVIRGHLLGNIEGDEMTFMYHSFNQNGELAQGNGIIHVYVNEDGRRELRERFDSDRVAPNELVLREL